MPRFEELLAGAAEMDAHVLSAPPEKNFACWHALSLVWNRNGLGFDTHAVMPYDERLALLPAYLQQLVMESLGKSVRPDGSEVDVATWLGGPYAKADGSAPDVTDEVRALVRAAPDDFLVMTPVSSRVNNVRNDDPACLLAGEEEPPPTKARAPRGRRGSRRSGQDHGPGSDQRIPTPRRRTDPPERSGRVVDVAGVASCQLARHDGVGCTEHARACCAA